MIWLGSSLEDVRVFPPDARRIAGYQLRRVQRGLMPSDWKPMKTIGHGVTEIRIHTGAEYRILYLARFADAVYVLHAFEKRVRRTGRADLDLATHRLAALIQLRSRPKER